ncbi:hypothetical protein AX17_004501 [Amanita inopinata Kibby_2008]|nr:hypothetical protein AX17_004501 [Amanita inopinata Kibby_2008]
MRNLSLCAASVTRLESTKVSTAAVDVDENILYAASESQNQDGEIDIELWKIPPSQADHHYPASISSPFALFASPISNLRPAASQIVSLKVLPEDRRIAAITRSGDITLFSLEDDFPSATTEGTVETGILVAAWSPDDLSLALITGEDKLILMTSSFDVISENSIETTEFGEDAPVNVGWGSKQTQFHGSLGKSAAQATTQTKVASSPDDDGVPRISWRGDGQYFVISTLSPPTTDGLRRRVLRVYDRQAILQSTSEAIGGLEHPISWRPSGNLIAGTQRFGFEGGGAGKVERHDVVFFERNGLRHGEFGLRAGDLGAKQTMGEQIVKRKWGYCVRELCWNPDSNILAVWIEKDEGDLVQLWTTGNYHWYLKQEISPPLDSDSSSSRFTSVNWHPEKPHQLILTTNSVVITRTYDWETFVSNSQPPNDSGSVAVFDGATILLTPFRTQNVPPPMSSHQLHLNPDLSAVPIVCKSLTPMHVSFSSEGNSLVILWESGYVECWNLRTRLGPGPEKVMDPIKTCSGVIDDSIHNWRQVAIQNLGTFMKASIIVSLGTSKGNDIISVAEIVDDGIRLSRKRELATTNNRLICLHPIVAVQDDRGGILELDPQTLEEIGTAAKFPEFCLQAQITGLPAIDRGNLMNDAERLYVALSASGKLYVAGTQHGSETLAHNVTSFTVASGFLIYTTYTHEAFFVPLDALAKVLSADGDELKRLVTTWETRKIERGSRIVVAVPSSMSLVLQMPRGNLETINPRALVMEVIKQDLDDGNYRKAFLACRKHRIDLTVIINHNQKSFFDRVPLFVEQVHEVDYLNLFLTVIGRGQLPPAIIAQVCDAIRSEAEKISLIKYVNTILTAYVVRSPPDHESALALLLKLRVNHLDIIEEAIKYIIFLVDADVLFNTALGMYDFALVLMIGQHSQKDPREYLPFLRDLRALDKYYQRFCIDDHLKRRESALKNLSLAGEDRFQEAIAYIENNQLYEPALSIWKDTKEYNTILELYGDWLFDRREFRSAALVFVEAQKYSKAMIAHERALEWRELFTIATLIDTPQDDIVEMGYRVAEELTSKKRYWEAGQVLLEYSKDVRQAVIALAEGNGFSEARRIIALNARPELMEEIVHPVALESRAQIAEDLGEMREQLRKQVDRLRELRVRKIEEPDAFYGTEDPTLHNIDVMTDVSMTGTMFTRYTVAASTLSKTSKRSSRSKRKLERKVGSGRKGTVDEEEYLLKSITKLVARFNTARDEAGNILPHLLQFTPEHREEGRLLQNELTEFHLELEKALEEIWAKRTDEENTQADGWAARMQEIERNKTINPIDKVPKPEISRGDDWRIALLSLGQNV